MAMARQWWQQCNNFTLNFYCHFCLQSIYIHFALIFGDISLYFFLLQFKCSDGIASVTSAAYFLRLEFAPQTRIETRSLSSRHLPHRPHPTPTPCRPLPPCRRLAGATNLCTGSSLARLLVQLDRTSGAPVKCSLSEWRTGERAISSATVHFE